MEGEIAIGIGETGNMEYLSAKITAFRRLHPQVRFQIYTAIADSIQERMEKGLLDMGVLTFPADTRKYDFLAMPLKDHWCALVRADDPLAQKPCLTATDLTALPLILPHRAEVRRELLARLSLEENALNITATSNLEMNGAIMVRNGVGIFLCLGINVAFEGLCRVPLEPRLETGSALVWKRGQIHTRAVAAFLDFMCQPPASAGQA